MDAFASPSIRARPPARKGGRAAELILAAAVLGLGLVAFPLAPNTQLDSSWQVMLVHAHAAGLQFGRDVIFTWGPWGYLCTRFELGRSCAGSIAAWVIGGSFLLAGALVYLSRDAGRGRRIALVAGAVAVNWLFQDAVYFAVIAAVGVNGLLEPGSPPGEVLAEVLLLGFLAQLKFTYLVLGGVVVAAAMGGALARRAPRRALLIGGGFAAGVLGAWVAAGQNLDNLYPYLRRSLDIAAGYAGAMQADENGMVFGVGVAVLGAALAWCWRRGRAGPGPGVWAAGALAASLLLMWKEAYTRADLVATGGHVLGLFSYLLILLPVVGGPAPGDRRGRGAGAVYLLALAGLALVDPAYFRLGPRVVLERFYGALRGLGRLGHLADDWEQDFRAAAAAADLPAVRAAVGSGTADAYDCCTGALILNGLPLSTRPIFQSYSAYSPSLEGWNLRYYQSARAPDFLLWNDDLVDHRYPAEDDAMLVAGLPGHYAPVLAEGRFALLRRLSPLSPLPPVRRLLFERTVRLGEEVVLPPFGGHPVWLEIESAANLLGRLRGLLYKPPTLEVVTEDDLGEQDRWRVVPRVAAAGFLLVPKLAKPADVGRYLQGQTETPVRAFHFEAPGTQDEFWDHFALHAFELSDQPLALLPSRRPVELGIFDRPAAALESQAQLEIFALPEGPALLLHAVGRLAFAVGGEVRRLSLAYGIRPGAYSGDGHSTGVEFSVERTTPAGVTERLWARQLDPAHNPWDQGTQRVEVALPAGGPATITLRTAPVPGPDNRWDWSYVSRVRLDAGAAP